MTQAKSASFRQAATSDIPAMSKIRLSVSENILSDPNRVTEQMYRDYLELLGRGWVAEINGEVVGFCYANGKNSSIWALFMSKEYEGLGLAKELLKTAVDWLFEQGNETVRLSTGIGTRADRFYSSQGWTRERDDGKEVFFKLTRPSVQIV